MNIKPLLVTSVALAAIAGIIWFVNREFPAAPHASGAGIEETVSSPETVQAAPPASDSTPQAGTSNAVELASLPSPDPAAITEQTKEARIEHLMDLSSNEDSASLSTILLELENPDKDVREAALEAAIQFGERTNTIARLTDLAQRTEDEDERAVLREAIEFIKLPSLTEVVNARKAAGLPTGVAKSSQPPRATTARMPKAPLPPGQIPVSPAASK